MVHGRSQTFLLDERISHDNKRKKNKPGEGIRNQAGRRATLKYYLNPDC